MSKELREEVFNIVHRAKNDTFRPLAASVAADKIVALFNRYAAEREGQANFKTMAYVLLSTDDGQITITKKALLENVSDYEISVQPDSRLSGGLVYSISPALKEPSNEA